MHIHHKYILYQPYMYIRHNAREDHRLITMGRGDYTKRVQEAIDKYKPDPNYFILGPTLPDISSTRARAALMSGDTATLETLLPLDVIHWLQMNADSPYARYYPNLLADGSMAVVGMGVVGNSGSDHYGCTGVVTSIGDSGPVVRWDGDGVTLPGKRQTLRRITPLVGVTGCSRSGKSWLSRLVAEELGGVVISQDHFWMRSVEVTLPDGRSGSHIRSQHALYHPRMHA